MPAILSRLTFEDRLILTGERAGRSFVVEVLGIRHVVQPAPYTVLLQLAAARYTSCDGFVDDVKLANCGGDPSYARKLTERLNKQAGDIVETSWRQHRLIYLKDKIVVHENVLQVPFGLIHMNVLNLLADAIGASVTTVSRYRP